MEPLSRVAGWLRSGSIDSSDLADLPWEVSIHGSGDTAYLVAVNPRIPVPVRITLQPSGLLRATIAAGVELRGLPQGVRCEAYRQLLLLDVAPHVKFYLAGPGEEIHIAADMCAHGLTEREVNDGLAALLLAYVKLYQTLGLKTELLERIRAGLRRLAVHQLRRGVAPEKVVELLVHASGVDQDTAREIVGEAASEAAAEGGYGQEEA